MQHLHPQGLHLADFFYQPWMMPSVLVELRIVVPPVDMQNWRDVGAPPTNLGAGLISGKLL